jgi:ATP-dependent 26S proteasome regulatory subunit
MDGLASADGVIVVATANDPALLGSALVKRPGRFDRVALFPAPTTDHEGVAQVPYVEVESERRRAGGRRIEQGRTIRRHER